MLPGQGRSGPVSSPYEISETIHIGVLRRSTACVIDPDAG